MNKFISSVSAAILISLGLAAPASADSTDLHVIDHGDTFWMLSEKHDIPLDDLMEMNPGKDAHNLQVGSTIVLDDAPVRVERTSRVERQSAPVKRTVWDRLAQCESGGDWSINTGNGFFGGAQFAKTSWDAMGGQEFAAYPHHASKAEQIIVAERLLKVQGWGAWPACSAKLGLR